MAEYLYLSVDQVKAITDAVHREVNAGFTWEEIKDKSLADLCSMNQDALIDDLHDDDPRDREHRSGMVGYVQIYDVLLDTHRADEIPPLIDGLYNDPRNRTVLLKIASDDDIPPQAGE